MLALKIMVIMQDVLLTHGTDTTTPTGLPWSGQPPASSAPTRLGSPRSRGVGGDPGTIWASATEGTELGWASQTRQGQGKTQVSGFLSSCTPCVLCPAPSSCLETDVMLELEQSSCDHEAMSRRAKASLAMAGQKDRKLCGPASRIRRLPALRHTACHVRNVKPT